MFALLAPAARQSAALTFPGRADGDGCSPATLILHLLLFIPLFFFLPCENPIFFDAFNLACVHSEDEVSGRQFVSFWEPWKEAVRFFFCDRICFGI